MVNVLSGIALSFRRMKGLHANEDRSRLYNSYVALFDLMVCVLNYSIFSKTNQTTIVHLFLVRTIIGLIGNYIAHVSLALRFVFSSLLNLTSAVFTVMLNLILLNRMLNLSKLCVLFKNFYERVPTSEDETIAKCEGLRLYYIIWIILESFVVTTKLIGAYFAYKANIVLRNIRKLKMNKILRRRRKKQEITNLISSIEGNYKIE